MADSPQHRSVRVAAVNAIGAICCAAIRKGGQPPPAILENLGFLRMIAANHDTQDSKALDEYLAKRFPTEVPQLTNGAVHPHDA